MELLFWIILISCYAFYGILILLFDYAWGKTPNFLKTKEQSSFTFISVIVAMRNEEKSILDLLNSLKAQNYPSENFELILINDHSTDHTKQIAEVNIREHNNIKIHNLTNTYGKKAALLKGLQEAKGELLVTTDADCIQLPQWLELFNDFYLSNNKPDMIIGLVDMIPARSLLQKCFRLDFLSLIASSTGAAYYRRPIFNNAANLGVKKSSCDLTYDFNSETASGDDVFLLHDFKKRSKSIHVLKSESHTVSTPPPSSLREFIAQRVRWASKVSQYKDYDSIYVAWLIFALNALTIVAIVLTPFTHSGIYLCLIYAFKNAIDLMLFLRINTFFKLERSLLLVPAINLFYPFYIVFSALVSIKKPFQWKGRKIS